MVPGLYSRPLQSDLGNHMCAFSFGLENGGLATLALATQGSRPRSLLYRSCASHFTLRAFSQCELVSSCCGHWAGRALHFLAC